MLEFRRHSLNMFLLAAAAAVQSVDRRLKSIVVPPPALEPATGTSGADDWRILATNSGTAALRVDRLTIGDIQLARVPALIARQGALTTSLLGNSVLNRLTSFTIEGDRLVMKQ